MGASCGVCRAAKHKSDLYIDEKKVPLGSGGATEDDNNNNTNYDDVDDGVTVDECAAYVMEELKVTEGRAIDMVLTLNKKADGLISAMELCLMVEKIKKIKDYLSPKFEEYISGKEGMVQTRDAVAIMRKEFPGIPEVSLYAMANRFVSGTTAAVDMDQFIEFFSFVKAKKTSLEAKFNELDSDQSGDLDADELVETLIMECALPELQARSLVDDFDINNNGTIDKEEFLEMWFRLFG